MSHLAITKQGEQRKITRYIHTRTQTFHNNKKESAKNTFRFENSGLLSISQRCEASCLKRIS